MKLSRGIYVYFLIVISQWILYYGITGFLMFDVISEGDEIIPSFIVINIIIYVAQLKFIALTLYCFMRLSMIDNAISGFWGWIKDMSFQDDDKTRLEFWVESNKKLSICFGILLSIVMPSFLIGWSFTIGIFTIFIIFRNKQNNPNYELVETNENIQEV